MFIFSIFPSSYPNEQKNMNLFETFTNILYYNVWSMESRCKLNVKSGNSVSELSLKLEKLEISAFRDQCQLFQSFKMNIIFYNKQASAAFFDERRSKFHIAQFTALSCTILQVNF